MICGIIKEKTEVIIMVEIITAVLVIFVGMIPYMYDKKKESKRLEDLYKPKNNNHDTDKWRR